ncbi:MAG: LysR family transcriptional regulator [Paucibacter sp.]|nr:LysR family transcriptional regulator [Roseateles sp.]
MKARPKAPLGQLADVDLRLLRVFKAVADCNGMAAAELELNIATSTISRHVKDLEERLGLVLCRRGRSGFGLTPEGQALYESAQQLLAATEGFRNQVNEIHSGISGELHLAVFEKTASNPACRLDRAVAAFRERAPEVRLNVHVGTIAMIERGVIGGEFHLGIVPEHRRSQSLAYVPLFKEQMQLYAGRGHAWFDPSAKRVSWADLRRQDLVGLGYHSPNMSLAHARQLQRKATASDQEAVATLVLSGCFVGFLPDHYAEPFVRAGRMRAVSPATLHYECSFSGISRRSPALPRVAGAFLDALRSAHA